MYFGEILRRQLDNANPKKYKNAHKKYDDSQKHRIKAKKRSE